MVNLTLQSDISSIITNTCTENATSERGKLFGYKISAKICEYLFSQKNFSLQQRPLGKLLLPASQNKIKSC